MLIVFAILLSPGVIALVLGETGMAPGCTGTIHFYSPGHRGVVLNLASIAVSYGMDLPKGYTLVFFHALSAIIIALTVGKRTGG